MKIKGKDILKPPTHLSKSAKDWWKTVANRVVLESHHYKLLLLACQAFDLSQEAHLELARVGRVFNDRFGCPKLHPLVLVERDARLSFAKLVRELGLDVVADDPHPQPVAGRAQIGE